MEYQHYALPWLALIAVHLIRPREPCQIRRKGKILHQSQGYHKHEAITVSIVYKSDPQPRPTPCKNRNQSGGLWKLDFSNWIKINNMLILCNTVYSGLCLRHICKFRFLTRSARLGSSFSGARSGVLIQFVYDAVITSFKKI